MCVCVCVCVCVCERERESVCVYHLLNMSGMSYSAIDLNFMMKTFIIRIRISLA